MGLTIGDHQVEAEHSVVLVRFETLLVAAYPFEQDKKTPK